MRHLVVRAVTDRLTFGAFLKNNGILQFFQRRILIQVGDGFRPEGHDRLLGVTILHREIRVFREFVELESGDAVFIRYVEDVDREGASRKPTGHITRTIRTLPEQYELLRSLGGSDFLRLLLDRIREGKVAIPVDTLKFTEEDQDRFIDGWTEAGGNTDDAEAENPWFAPWEWSPEIIVRGTTPEEWGADFYRQCKPEIDAMLTADDDE